MAGRRGGADGMSRLGDAARAAAPSGLALFAAAVDGARAGCPRWARHHREAQTLMSSISTFTFSSTSMPLAGARSARSSNLGCDIVAHAEVFSKKILWVVPFFHDDTTHRNKYLCR